MFVILSSWHNEFICQVYLPIIEQRQEITNPQIKLTEVGPLAAIVHTRRRYLILLPVSYTHLTLPTNREV